MLSLPDFGINFCVAIFISIHCSLSLLWVLLALGEIIAYGEWLLQACSHLFCRLGGRFWSLSLHSCQCLVAALPAAPANQNSTTPRAQLKKIAA